MILKHIILLDYPYLKENYKITVTDSNKQQA